jgi:hypothetical protein
MRRAFPKPLALAVAFYLLVAAVLLAPSLFGGRQMVPWDNLYAFQPWRAQAAEAGVERPHNVLISDILLLSMPWQELACSAWEAGARPAWTPGLLCGKPMYSGLLHGFRYPPNILWRILTPGGAAVWLFAFHLVLGATLTALLARRLGLSAVPATMAGLVYSLCGPVFLKMTFHTMQGGLAWMPGCLLAVRALADAFPGRPVRATGWLLFGLAAHAMAVLAGHPEMAFYVFFLSGSFAAWQALQLVRRRRPRAALVLPATVAVYALAGLIIVAPDLASFRHSQRSGTNPVETVRSYALPPARVAALVMPNAFGGPVQHRFFDPYAMTIRTAECARTGVPSRPIDWGAKNYIEGAMYFGILPLALLFPALADRRRGSVFFFVALPLTLLMAFGTPLYAIFYHVVPFADQLRTPFRWMIPAALCFAVLAGFGLQGWIESGKRRRILPGFILCAAAVAALVAVVVAGLFEEALRDRLGELVASHPRLARSFADGSEFLRYEAGQLVWAAAALLFAGLAWLTASRWAKPRVGALILVGAAAVDLGLWARPFYSHSPPGLRDRVPPPIEFLQRQPGLFRIGATLPRGERHVPPNSAMLYGLHDLRGYDAILPKPYVDFLARIFPQQLTGHNIAGDWLTPEALASPWLDFLNVEFVFSDWPVHAEGWTRCFDGELAVYRNEQVFPRYYLAAELPAGFEDGPPEPMGEGRYEVQSYGLTHVSLDVDAPCAAWLVSSETDYGLWTPRVDGRDAEKHLVLDLFRAVRVPPGRHKIEWVFQNEAE